MTPRRAPRPSFIVAYGDALTGGLDIEATIAALRPDQRVKGILFGDLVAALGAQWDDIAKTLTAPPRLGRYLPFIAYDAGDYLRILAAAIAVKYPHKSAREGARLVGRRSIDTFIRSQLGSVVMPMIDGPSAILAKYPSIYMSLVAGTPASGRSTGERSFEITMERFAGVVESSVGSLEESVRHFRFTPTSEVRFEGDDLTIALRW